MENRYLAYYFIDNINSKTKLLIKKFKKIFTADSSPEKYISAVDEYNKKRLEEEIVRLIIK